MSTKKIEEIVAYSMDFNLPRQVGDDSVKDLPRFALANLLITAGTLLQRDDNDFDIESPSKLILELETDKWDQRFILRIEKITKSS